MLFSLSVPWDRKTAAAKALGSLINREGLSVPVTALDEKMLDRLAEKHRLLVTMEENVKSGGFGMAVADYMRRNHPNVRVLLFAVPDQFIEHGNPEKLKEKLGHRTDLGHLCPSRRQAETGSY